MNNIRTAPHILRLQKQYEHLKYDKIILMLKKSNCDSRKFIHNFRVRNKLYGYNKYEISKHDNKRNDCRAFISNSNINN